MDKDGESLNAADILPPYGAMFAGVPTLMGMSAMGYNSPNNSAAGAHGACTATAPLDGKVIEEWSVTSKAICEAEGFDGMRQVFVHDKIAKLICMLVFDKMDQQHCAAVDRIFDKLFCAGKERGFSIYRAHVSHMGEPENVDKVERPLT